MSGLIRYFKGMIRINVRMPNIRTFIVSTGYVVLWQMQGESIRSVCLYLYLLSICYSSAK